MIDREDMLALTRRMTVKRTSMTRIAGGYMDSDGCIDGTFNIAFLKLSPADREKNLQIAKKVPFAETNQNLQEYKFLQENMQNDSLWKLLMGMRACGLKNDALMETFYEICAGENRCCCCSTDVGEGSNTACEDVEFQYLRKCNHYCHMDKKDYESC